MSDFLERLGNVDLDVVLAPTRAPVGPMPNAEYAKLAREAKARLEQGKSLTAMQAQAIELAVRALRPLVKVTADAGGKLDADLDATARPAFPKWDAFVVALRPALRSVGAVEFNGLGSWRVMGTGFLVSDRLMLTNRHVLGDVTFGSMGLVAGSVRVNFDSGQIGAKSAAVIGVKKWSEDFDLALLELEPQPGVQLLELAAADPKRLSPMAAVGHPVAGTGYPGWVQGLLGNAVGTKRISPGVVLSVSKTAVFHDATTVGGNSGSPLLSLDDARVMGLHHSGEFAYRNGGVPVSEVKKFLA